MPEILSSDERIFPIYLNLSFLNLIKCYVPASLSSGRYPLSFFIFIPFVFLFPFTFMSYYFYLLSFTCQQSIRLFFILFFIISIINYV